MKRLVLSALALGFICLSGAILSQAQAGGKKKNPLVVMEFSQGTILLELFEDKAPITVKNFLDYVDAKFYDGTIFHRVIPDFMIQGGGFLPGMKEKKTRDPIKNESFNGISNERGTLAMARTPDPDSATAQFYINVEDNENLDKKNAGDKVGYAVFGKVIEGMGVVDKIRRVKTGRFEGASNVPLSDVVIMSIRRAK